MTRTKDRARARTPRGTDARPKRGRVRRWLLNPWLFQTIVGAALIGAAVYEFDLRQVAHSFNDVRYQWLVAAFALYVTSRLLHAIEWRITLSAVGRFVSGYNAPERKKIGITRKFMIN